MHVFCIIQAYLICFLISSFKLIDGDLGELTVVPVPLELLVNFELPLLTDATNFAMADRAETFFSAKPYVDIIIYF